MTVAIIVQARTKSTRFPRKIYEDINGKYTLQRVLEGATSSVIPNKIILAMPEYDRKEFEERYNKGEFSNFADERFCTYFGSADNLTERYFMAAREYEIDTIVRITADCPLVQGWLIDQLLTEYFKNGYNGYMSCNDTTSGIPYPNGVDCQVFPYWMLADTLNSTKDPVHLEHCCPYMYRQGTQYNIYSYNNSAPHKTISTKFRNFSFDTPEDLNLIKKITSHYDEHGDLDRAIKETNEE